MTDRSGDAEERFRERCDVWEMDAIQTVIDQHRPAIEAVFRRLTDEDHRGKLSRKEQHVRRASSALVSNLAYLAALIATKEP